MVAGAAFVSPQTVSVGSFVCDYLLPRNFLISSEFESRQAQMFGQVVMGFGKGAQLWLLGIPLPIIILLAIFMHH